MRRTSFSTWLLLAAVLTAVVVSRLGRALGPAGIVAAVVVVVVGIIVLRFAIEAARVRSAAAARQVPPKNVTPVEPALSPGASPSAWPTKVEGPSVVVIDPPTGTERLAAKLQALDDLRADGLVTDDEYEAKRAQLIADF